MKTPKTIKVENLKTGFHIFGNKGSVWNNEAHIAEDGMNPKTLCGVPMLSNNHALYEGVKEIGCQECIKIYLKK